MITISIMLANIMQGVDNTILNVALPHIQGSLSASLDQIAWALTSYIVCAAIMMPLTGWLAGRFGIKYIFLVSVIGFTLASALCGAATSTRRTRPFSCLAGCCRGRVDPAVAGDPVTDQPAGAPWACYGGVWHRHDLRPDYGAGARRLVDR